MRVGRPKVVRVLARRAGAAQQRVLTLALGVIAEDFLDHEILRRGAQAGTQRRRPVGGRKF